jgi:hypothetical protein
MTEQVNRATVGASSLGGSVALNVLSFATTWAVSASAAVCQAVVKALENVLGAMCTVSRTIFTTTFRSWPEAPMKNTLHSHTGNPPLQKFTCDTTALTGSPTTTSVISNSVNRNITENDYCARRDICGISAGQCQCKAGSTGNARNAGTTTVTTSDSVPDRLVNLTGAAYTGGVLKLKTTKFSATTFRFMKCETASTQVFFITGDAQPVAIKMVAMGGGTPSAGGTTTSDQGLHVTNGQSFITHTGNFATGGIAFTAGGQTISAGELVVSAVVDTMSSPVEIGCPPAVAAMPPMEKLPVCVMKDCPLVTCSPWSEVVAPPAEVMPPPTAAILVATACPSPVMKNTCVEAASQFMKRNVVEENLVVLSLSTSPVYAAPVGFTSLPGTESDVVAVVAPALHALPV